VAGINISFVSDVRAFLTGTKRAEDALDDLGGSLDDLTRDAQDTGRRTADALEEIGDGAKDAGRDLERHLEDGAEAGESAAKGLEAKFRDVFGKVRGDAKVAGDKIGTEIETGTEQAEGGLDEFKDEANSTAREAAASFDGSADSIGDAFQEVAANAFAGFGPAGAIAGLGIAAGIGIGMAALNQTAEEAAETKQRIIDLAGAIRDAGGDLEKIDWVGQFRDFGNEIVDAKSWFEPWQDAGVTAFERISEEAERFGLDYAQLFQGMAGDQDNAARSLDVINDKIAELTREYDASVQAQVNMSDERGRSASVIADEVAGLEDLKSRLQDASGQTDEAIELERLMQDAYAESAAGIAEKNEALREQAELTADAISSELDYLDAIEDSTEKLRENAEKGFDKSTSAGRENLRTLGEMAQATLDFSDATLESTGSQEKANDVIASGREEVVKAGEALGMSKADAEAYADALGLIPGEVKTTAKADTTRARADFDELTRTDTKTIDVQADLTVAKRQIANWRPVVTVSGRIGQQVV